MIIETIHIKDLNVDEIHKFWAEGWDRSADVLFRHQVVLTGNFFTKRICTVVPLRVYLPNFVLTKSQRKILKKCSAFTTKVVPFEITDELREIYQIYKRKFADTRETLDDYFIFGMRENLFPTEQIMVYDGDRLIAASFFDEGKDGIYSIVGIYLPEYNKYSLGTLTMLLEIEYAIKTNKTYYYPGHALDEPSFYDYKLKFSALQYYDWKGNWKEIEHLPHENTYMRVLKSNLEELETRLHLEKNKKCSFFLNLEFLEKFYNCGESADNLPLYLHVETNPYFEFKISYDPNQEHFLILSDLTLIGIQQKIIVDREINGLINRLEFYSGLVKIYAAQIEKFLIEIALFLPFRPMTKKYKQSTYDIDVETKIFNEKQDLKLVLRLSHVWRLSFYKNVFKVVVVLFPYQDKEHVYLFYQETKTNSFDMLTAKDLRKEKIIKATPKQIAHAIVEMLSEKFLAFCKEQHTTSNTKSIRFLKNWLKKK